MNLRSTIRRVVVALRVPQAIPAAGFLVVILVGSALLSLPWTHSGSVGYLDALFTSTSAVCVTGLVTVNTATDYSVAGQVVILILIQIGGLGVMTYAAMVLSVLRRRLSLRTQAALHDSLFQKDDARDFRRRFRQIVSITFAVEALGALVLFFSLLPSSQGASAAWRAVFHSISAFCNAGFSILPDNLVDVRGNLLFMIVIMILVVVGGLGFTVLHELTGEGRRVLVRKDRQHPRRFSLHTNVVLRTSLILVVGGAALMLLFGMTVGEQSWGARIEAALFQSISARTAGFNTVEVAALPVASLLILASLMFIGGSPGSCAGGVKTSSLAVIFARIRSYLTGEEEARLMGRKLNRDLIRSAGLLFALALVWNLVGLLVLAHFEKAREGIELQHLLFEQVSAFATVGLSTGTTTAGLSVAGKLWIMATMYVGRLGPLTLASLAIYRRTSRITFPEGKVMIG
jgi:trk/ktr system potassium uptake protein